jgi:glycerol-3-phosphate dehydrogenase (NAD(P)+)
LPGVKLPEAIIPTTDLAEVLCEPDWVFEAIPVKYLRAVLTQAAACARTDQTWVILSKGIEDETLLLPSQIIDEVFGYLVKKAAVLGPSYAKDLAQKQFTAVTVGAIDCQVGYAVQELLASEYFRPYVNLDLNGVQLGGAIKNVLALGIGMLEGAGYGDNARCFLLTRGLHEMVELTQAIGGKAATMYGLSGVGDLVLTAMGDLSRNKEVGVRLGKGQSLQSILDATGYIPEGINTVISIYQLAQNHKLSLPILQGINDCIFKELSLEKFLTSLMKMPLEDECAL